MGGMQTHAHTQIEQKSRSFIYNVFVQELLGIKESEALAPSSEVCDSMCIYMIFSPDYLYISK